MGLPFSSSGSGNESMSLANSISRFWSENLTLRAVLGKVLRDFEGEADDEVVEVRSRL